MIKVSKKGVSYVKAEEVIIKHDLQIKKEVSLNKKKHDSFLYRSEEFDYTDVWLEHTTV